MMTLQLYLSLLTIRPEEGFVYLENEGNMHFKALTIAEARQGNG
jgi:hypothetical protein